MSNIVVSNLSRRKGRTLITIVAVAVSCALLVSMLSVSEGMMKNAEETIKLSKVDLTIGGSINNIHQMIDDLEGDTDNVNVANPIYYSSLTISVPPNGDVVPAIAQGLIPQNTWDISTEEERGRLKGEFEFQNDPFYQDGTYAGGVDSPLFTGEMMITRHMALDYDLDVGDSVEVLHQNETLPFTIVAIWHIEIADDAPFRLYFAGIHLSELQFLSALPGTPISEMDRGSRVEVYLSNDVRTSLSAVREYTAILEDRYQLLNVETKEDQIANIEKSVTISKAYYGALGSVAVSIGMLFVICIVIMNIAERTKEIGILRAIGIRKTTIFTMFFLESLAMVFIGSVFGVILGIVGSHYLGEYIAGSIGFESDITVVTPSLIILSMGATNLLGSLASLYPGYRASKMKIVEAMKNV